MDSLSSLTTSWPPVQGFNYNQRMQSIKSETRRLKTSCHSIQKVIIERRTQISSAISSRQRILQQELETLQGINDEISRNTSIIGSAMDHYMCMDVDHEDDTKQEIDNEDLVNNNLLQQKKTSDKVADTERS